MSRIKTIIFDLGGVIIDLHVEKTVTAFSQLSGLTENEVEEAYLSADFFKHYEKGLLSDFDFRQKLRDNFNLRCTDKEIDQAWNAMLGDIPADRIESVIALMENYKCVVLSNTNAIHEDEFHKILSDSFPYQYLSDLFHEVYFSHNLLQRKPDTEIYETILNQAETEAADALFMDDSQLNLDAASALGIHTLHIPRNGGFMHLLERKLAEI